jgi:hypothetical protein
MHCIKKQTFLMLVPALLYWACSASHKVSKTDREDVDVLKKLFVSPPDSFRPGVYWYFMDGNMSKEGMTKDLEAMTKAGIGNLIFLEVNVGIPRGPVNFLSDQWQELFSHAVSECKRLGIKMTLGIGPGWTGSGGPWVSLPRSMQHLVSSTVEVTGANQKKIRLPVPQPHQPYFGEGTFTPELKKQWNDFYQDVAVLAFPTPVVAKKIEDSDEKALYYRAPYSSTPNVKQYLPSLSDYPDLPKSGLIAKDRIIDITKFLLPDGTLNWKVPAGNWTIMRFGKRNNGAVTRPAPLPGLGFESDKFDTVALNAHLDEYIGKLLRKTGESDAKSSGGLKMLHMDSWEMSSQNWTSRFREEFIKRRGYDPLLFYPVYAGNIVESLEVSERFLWDLRLTSQELILEYHAGQVKKYGHRHGLGLSIEPYDMNPTADLELGAVADVPMCEFWSKDYGFNSSFSCIEATSIAHINGISLVPAEAFTAEKNEGWKQYPGSMKAQSDWAFAAGINRFVFHTFQHQFLNDSLRPGMTMGPYGIHWDRGQTWWPMVGAYHQYITRCQFMLQQGRSVADILYLTPEGAPHVFRPPSSALTGDAFLPDRRGYNFDGCSPGQLYKAVVKDNQIVFPGGASYRLLVLPLQATMTPALLEKIASLVRDGATVVGVPPLKSPGLSGFPQCDKKVQSIALNLWGGLKAPSAQTEQSYGKGKIIWGGDVDIQTNNIFPSYDLTAKLLHKLGVAEDFKSDTAVRYTHRSLPNSDIYFVSNRTDKPIKTDCTFRSDKSSPELWDPVTGKIRKLPEYKAINGSTTIPLQFESFQSFFISFKKGSKVPTEETGNFPAKKEIASLNGAWDVSFDPAWGGPKNIRFDTLADWTTRQEEGIKYYSGTATYRKNFDFANAGSARKNARLYLDLGDVKNMARVWVNGHDLGVVWTAPARVDITEVVKDKSNTLEIEVVNLWPNRLIGDENLPDDGVKHGEWPDWLVNRKARTSGRYTFTTYKHYTKDSPLLESGLLGPVTIQEEWFK